MALSRQVDFHVVRAAGDRIYGFDSNSGHLLVSQNGGRTWATGGLVGPLLDLAVDPQDERHLLASTERGLQTSDDGGTEWRRVGPETGLLAWSTRADLFLVEQDGRVYGSRTGGRTWRRTGTLGEQPVALLADAGRLLAPSSLESRVSDDDDGGTRRPHAEL